MIKYLFFLTILFASCADDTAEERQLEKVEAEIDTLGSNVRAGIDSIANDARPLIDSVDEKLERVGDRIRRRMDKIDSAVDVKVN